MRRATPQRVKLCHIANFSFAQRHRCPRLAIFHPQSSGSFVLNGRGALIRLGVEITGETPQNCPDFTLGFIYGLRVPTNIFKPIKLLCRLHRDDVVACRALLPDDEFVEPVGHYALENILR